jgi:hypothetical protein
VWILCIIGDVDRTLARGVTMMKKPAAYDNAWLGNMNCYVAMTVTFKRKRLTYDGTTKGMVQALIAAGAKEGDTCVSETGNKYRIYINPKDDRVNGFWATRI